MKGGCIMKRKLVITFIVIGIASMVSTNAFALLKCGARNTCPTRYTAYPCGGSCFCVRIGSLFEEITDKVANEKKYPTAIEIVAEPLPCCWDSNGDSCDDIYSPNGLNGGCDEGSCTLEDTELYDVIIGCGTPGNGLLAPGQNKLPYFGAFTGFESVSKKSIDRNGIARLLVNLDPPEGLIDFIVDQHICPNPHWDIDVLPFRLEVTVTDIVADNNDPLEAKCYERSVAVDYFELRNPDKILWDKKEKCWVECVAWTGEEYTGDNCTETVPAEYEGLGLDFFDYSKELEEHPYNVDGTCPIEIFNN
jgi:hypothetical protein